ncbi:organomercurial transporter MerC [Rhodanobacter sp. OR444]|uniref:organomercurial transporter MerC n=1 Tax=Rhodanobacter sp. OR444 TaxID=1076525 RepID=UPI0003F67834|nr:organomercurial transporter MerC [Rhodanobacter sp. OR444]
MKFITRSADKAGVIGVIVAAMGCAACFPAIASLGAVIGLGFLSRYEGLFITILMPVFALVALFAYLISWRGHRQWRRMLPGVIGALLVLAAAVLMRFLGWPTAWLLYPGLALMLAASFWDLFSPASRVCIPAAADHEHCC